MTRTDVHAPASANFDPALYTFINVFDLQEEARDLGQAEREVTAAGFSYPLARDSYVRCAHCGSTRLRYVALMTRADVMEAVFIGKDCLDNRFLGMTKALFDAKMERAAQLRKERAKQHGIALLVNENPALMALLDRNELVSGNEFLSSLAWKLAQYGELSERQVEAAKNALVREAERAAKRAAWAAEKAAEKAALLEAGVAAPLGRVTVTGTVLSAKSYDGDYGVSHKMLVQHAEGWKVWSGVPAAMVRELMAPLYAAMEEGSFDYPTESQAVETLKGRTVTFTATLELKDASDPTFAKASRPSKASIAA